MSDLRQPSVLKARAQFLAVANKGHYVATKGIVVQRLAVPESQISIGFTVTKKLGNAVVRNRIKRRLRSVAKEVFHSSAKLGYHYVLIGRSATKTRSYQSLVGDLRYAIKQLDRKEQESR